MAGETRMIWHKGTGTIIVAEECVVVEVPDNVEDAEQWIVENDPKPVLTFGGNRFLASTATDEM